MGKYPIRLIGTPVVPGDLDYDMDPPEWHTPWFEADALDADGHHHRVYWPIPNKTNLCEGRGRCAAHGDRLGHAP